MLKLVGCLFVIISSSGIGFLLGSRFGERVEDIRNFRTSIQMLETEISYSHTPLPEAFVCVAKKSGGAVRAIFEHVGDSLGSRRSGNVGDAFASALNRSSGSVSLSPEDMGILKSFGHSLGCSDVDGQMKCFKLVSKQLEAQQAKAEQERGKNERMYKSLGVLTGLAVSILLL